VSISPCPFCAGTDARIRWGGFGKYCEVDCQNDGCGAQGPPKRTEEEAVAAWNGAHCALTARDELLREWLEAEEAPYPYAEEGIEAQRAWSHRRHAARDAARAILAKGETK
jgi:hypothetical protein